MDIATFKHADAEAISRLFAETFTHSAGEAEGQVLGDLVRDIIVTTDPDDLFGFVLIDQQKIIGGVFFTRLTVQTGLNAFLLSPMAIHPDYQGRGLGQKLINFALDCLKDNNVTLVMTYGDPDFYSKVGFSLVSEKMIKPPYTLSQPQGWLALSLTVDNIMPTPEKMSCVAALQKPEIW